MGLLVLAAVQGVHALEFDLPVRTANSKTQPAAKCILEETNANVLVLLEFQSVDDSNVTVKLEHPDGSEMWALERVTKGQYGFSTPVEGDYKICFLPSDTSNPGALDTHKIRLQWKTGVAATDWDNIAKRTKVDAMAMSLRELESEIKEIHEGMLYLRRREEEMRDINEGTNGRVAWMSVLSLGICVGMSVWQLLYLKRFFIRKKLL